MKTGGAQSPLVLASAPPDWGASALVNGTQRRENRSKTGFEDARCGNTKINKNGPKSSLSLSEQACLARLKRHHHNSSFNALPQMVKRDSKQMNRSASCRSGLETSMLVAQQLPAQPTFVEGDLLLQTKRRVAPGYIKSSSLPCRKSHFDTGLSNISFGVGEMQGFERTSFLDDIQGLQPVPGYLAREADAPPQAKSFTRPWQQDWRRHGEGLSLAHGKPLAPHDQARRELIAPKQKDYEKYMERLRETAKIPQARSNARPWQMDTSGRSLDFGWDIRRHTPGTNPQL